MGHQYQSVGERFLDYLETNGLKGSEQYLLAQEAIEQGKFYYRNNTYDPVYRERKMVKNFIREFNDLSGENIMGIYGSAHTGLDAMIGSVPTMATQLKERYGDTVHVDDLVLLARDNRPYKIDSMIVDGKEYEASYFGQQNLLGFNDYAYREFWRLENAYTDFKDKPRTGQKLPYNNYPMLMETGQIYVVDFTKRDESTERMYFRSDGLVWNDLPSTEEFVIN